MVNGSCTIPHKEAAVKCCDEVDPVAKVIKLYILCLIKAQHDGIKILQILHLQSIGAVNCIIRRESDGKLFGYNTDYVGAISAIEDGLRGISEIILAYIHENKLL